MRRPAVYPLAALLVASAALLAPAPATAQEGPLVLRVKPRSFLDPGNVAPVGSMNRYVTSGQMSILVNPPWPNNERLGGAGILPDPIGGPFVGARNPFEGIETTGSVR